MKVRGTDVKTVAEVNDVYAEDLNKIIETQSQYFLSAFFPAQMATI